MDDAQPDVTMAQSAIQLGIAPSPPAGSPAARIAALEAEVARLIAENVALAGDIVVLPFIETNFPPAVRPPFPIRALGRHAMRIGLISEFGR